MRYAVPASLAGCSLAYQARLLHVEPAAYLLRTILREMNRPCNALLSQDRFSHALQLFAHLGFGLDMFRPHHDTVGTGIEERLHNCAVR